MLEALILMSLICLIVEPTGLSAASNITIQPIDLNVSVGASFTINCTAHLAQKCSKLSMFVNDHSISSVIFFSFQ